MALRKRMSRKELQKTDPLTAALEDFAAKLLKYRRSLILIGVAIVGLLSAAIGFRQWSDAQAYDRADAVSAAYSVLGATVGTVADENQDDSDRRLNFADEEAKNTALSEKIGVVTAGYEGTKLSALARIIGASGKVEGVDVGALRSDSAFLLEGEPALSEWLQLSLGRVAWTAGDSDGASLDFAAIANDDNASVSARTMARVYGGDLQNPAFGGKGDPEKARESYRAALKLIDTSIASRSGLYSELRSEVAVRLALLPGGSLEVLAPISPEKAEGAETASP